MADQPHEENSIVDRITAMVSGHAYWQLAEKLEPILDELLLERGRELDPVKVARLEGQILAHTYTIGLMVSLIPGSVPPMVRVEAGIPPLTPPWQGGSLAAEIQAGEIPPLTPPFLRQAQEAGGSLGAE
jgi:hypothetical protein